MGARDSCIMNLLMWYAAYLIYFRDDPARPGLQMLSVQQDLLLVEASDPYKAYNKASTHGKQTAFASEDSDFSFQGLTDLIPLPAGVHDGVIIDTASDSIDSTEIPLFLASKDTFTVRAQETELEVDGSEHWFLAQLVFSSLPQWELAEARQQVMKELMLVRAVESDAAFYRAVVFGKDRSIRLNPPQPGGQWHFRGLNDLTFVERQIEDGTQLLSERFQVPFGHHSSLVKPKELMKALIVH